MKCGRVLGARNVVALAAALAFTRAALFTCPRLECLHVSDGWREVFDSTHGRTFWREM